MFSAGKTRMIALSHAEERVMIRKKAVSRQKYRIAQTDSRADRIAISIKVNGVQCIIIQRRCDE